MSPLTLEILRNLPNPPSLALRVSNRTSYRRPPGLTVTPLPNGTVESTSTRVPAVGPPDLRKVPVPTGPTGPGLTEHGQIALGRTLRRLSRGQTDLDRTPWARTPRRVRDDGDTGSDRGDTRQDRRS